MHQLMIIGEIARSLTPGVRERHPQVPWGRMRGFRNVALHEYFAIDWSEVWSIASEDVPALEPLAMAVLRTEAPELAKQLEER